MNGILPASKPKMTRQELKELIRKAHPDYTIPDIAFVGVRGYYKNTMGKVGINDRCLYDDAIFILTNEEFLSFNGNCDPGAFRPGIANLKAGIWPVYKFDLHKGLYLALCQRGGTVTVLRDKKDEDTGEFGINIHKGGHNVTSSLGCQTIPPSQWSDFILQAQKYAAKYIGVDWKKKHDYTYILLEQ